MLTYLDSYPWLDRLAGLAIALVLITLALLPFALLGALFAYYF